MLRPLPTPVRFRFTKFAHAAGLMGGVAGMVLGPVEGEIIDLSGSAYRHSFTTGCSLSVLALLPAWRVHRNLVRLGGPGDYLAPEWAVAGTSAFPTC